MNIILSNGKTLEVKSVIGKNDFVQGRNRDCLTFVFDGNEDMNVIDSAFAEDLCENIHIVDGDQEYVYQGYTIRHSIVKKTEEIEGGDLKVVIQVKMGKRSWEETKIAALENDVDDFVVMMLKEDK